MKPLATARVAKQIETLRPDPVYARIAACAGAPTEKTSSGAAMQPRMEEG